MVGLVEVHLRRFARVWLSSLPCSDTWWLCWFGHISQCTPSIIQL